MTSSALSAGGRPLRVLHVITGLRVGGAESMLTNLATLAPRALLDQCVVSLTPGGDNRVRLEQAGIPVSDLGMVRNLPNLPALFRLAGRMRAFRPDVVQSWMYHADLYALAALALSGRRGCTRLAWGVRCSDMDTSRYSRRLRQVIGLCARLSGLPDAVVANSHTGRAVHQALGYAPRRFDVIANGIDVDRFRPHPELRAAMRAGLGIPADVPVVAIVARVDPMKDHAGFLRAMDQVPDAHALLVGEGTLELPAGPRIHRIGRRGDVPEVLAAADLIVSASAFGEGFSNALAEGMACGLAAVATEVGDARVVLGPTGRVVPPRDPEALAQAIRALLDGDAATLAARGAEARRHIVENFAMDKIIQTFAGYYAQLVRPCAA